MQHTRTWSDVYGSARALFEGRAGGHAWLIAAPPALARLLPAQLESVDGKGRVALVVHEGLTPLLAAVQQEEPRGVIVVAAGALSRGPALTVPDTLVDDLGGVPFRDGGAFPAWVGADGQGDRAGECAAASAVAGLGVPVVVTTPDGVAAALTAWMDRTPHGR
ncbi:hypothetical protein LAJ19_12080 [Deinococcus taeanensis]|uniref:hypothetical protein n=1 Tax=Deinococcus taeanensis TaxID=2737050 RepID=UPI001CDBCF79|nr:hypothetical protein [Deinococcus taeanensis]UBV42355.1 hypothetical protein LAJ19_12080 [Deinococcus taeanensis]